MCLAAQKLSKTDLSHHLNYHIKRLSQLKPQPFTFRKEKHLSALFSSPACIALTELANQCRSKLHVHVDATKCIRSGSPLFANMLAIFSSFSKPHSLTYPITENGLFQHIVWGSLSSLKWVKLND